MHAASTRPALRGTCGRALLLGIWIALAGCGDGTPAERVDGRTRTAWERQLQDFSPSAKAEALAALARFEDPPLETLAEHLGHKARLVRTAAIEALGHVGRPAAAYAERLVPYLEGEPDGMDARAAKALRDAAMGALGAMGPEAFKTFSHLLVSEDPSHRARAVYTMRPFVTELEDGTNTVLPLLRDDEAVVRREAVKSLGEAGKGDPRASEALMEALRDDDAGVAAAAAVALGGIGGRSDREGKALSRLLYAHRQHVRASAAYGLGLMGVEASPYLKQLWDLMRNDNRRLVRIQAARACYRISGETEEPLAQLEKEAQSGDTGLTHDAIKAIGEMGAEAAPAVGSLVAFLDRPDTVRHAARALAAIGAAAAEALPHLRRILERLPPDHAARIDLDAAVAAIGGD